MKAGRKAHIALPAALTACFLLLLLVSGFYFARYLQAQIFQERTTQLNEITSQVRVNLGTALDAHWKYLNTAVNLLSAEEYASAEEVMEYVPGKYQMDILQYPKITVEYLGTPTYVPPSADPNYEEKSA